MTELELSDGLIRRLKELFKGQVFMNRSGDSVLSSDVKVYAQHMPNTERIKLARNTDVDEDTEDEILKYFPAVIVKISSRKDNEERSIVMSQITVKLISAVYDESRINEGYRDLMNMQTMMRDAFMVNRFIAQKFRILMPMETKMLDTDTWPISFSELELKLETGRKVSSMEEYIYGGGLSNGRKISEYGRISDIRIAS